MCNCCHHSQRNNCNCAKTRGIFFICQNLYFFFRNILSKFRKNKLNEAVYVVNVTEVKK